MHQQMQFVAQAPVQIDTIPPEVKHKREERTFTDAVFAFAFIVSMLAFLIIGFMIMGSTHPAYDSIDYKDAAGNDRFVNTVSEFYQEDAQLCCATAGVSQESGLCTELTVESGRRALTARLLAADGEDFKSQSNFDYKKGDMFEAFSAHPEIPATLISTVLVIAVGWILLLRTFSREIVFTTELVKVACIIYMAAKVPDANTKTVFYLMALAYFGLIVWKKDKLEFAAKIISHSALALKSNPGMFVGLVFVKLFYVLHAYLFVQFFISAVQVKEVGTFTWSYGGAETCSIEGNDNYCQRGRCTDEFGDVLTAACVPGEVTTISECEFSSPAWLGDSLRFLMFTWLWAVMFYTQLRLSIIASIVGSWHFHPDNKPSVSQAVLTSVTKSMGTIAFSSLILTIIERIKRAAAPKWYHFCGPQACLFTPLFLLSCALKFCLETCVKMLTKFTLIIHVFTGLNFFDSAKKCFGIMTRHFENGFITDYATTSVLKLGSFVFSIAVTFACWAWIDETYSWTTLPQGGEDTLDVIIFYGWFFAVLFNLWYPVLGVFIIICVNNLLAVVLVNDKGEVQCQEVWVAPMAACFVGVISKMFFEYMAGIILDTVDVCFVCYAVDKDNGVDMKNDSFGQYVVEMPDYIKARPVDAINFPGEGSGGGQDGLLSFGANGGLGVVQGQVMQQQPPPQVQYQQQQMVMQQQHGKINSI